ncbi:helveticin J family class III bacteriocin [Lactobacillus helveticus]
MIDNNVWLTVAYHDMDTSTNLTVMNRIYKISW